MRNSKKTVEKHDLHVKTGDRVIITSGKDKGKIGNVKTIIASENKVVVEGANMITKAVKANPMAGVQGGLTQIEAPWIHQKLWFTAQAAKKQPELNIPRLKVKKSVFVLNAANKLMYN